MSVKNIQEVQVFEDQRINKQLLFTEEKSNAFILNLMPGQMLPSHSHPNSQVYLLVLEGEGECFIDNRDFKIQQLDVIHCSNDQMLSIKNTGNEKMCVYVVLAKVPKM
ncbi:cupin domain-containing protein [Bacillus sp. CECT 9360]|uniref:cupin domain-containing protein n=1 Tax=Bacillus sp. CECT 9360 TaxID=2845821 RepID=UPI001E3F39C6|nr:cupin domain-containing protein [Bacillus sp. CECT 9360]CAH0345779.1 hypothetical protein BCI9360_02077 [Bacillus sp. CECT 9360]